MRVVALLILTTVAVVAASVYATLPADRRSLEATSPAGVRGAMHIHTRRSDGSGTPDDVAAAAARAGLAFVILTDHGDGTRTPARPEYQRGVLVVDALEVAGDGGHMVALGLPKTPYPLGGEVRDIVDDIRRMGGMAIAAHPGSLKPELRWTDWSVPVDGLEWLNGDSESRDESWLGLARVMLTYPFRASESIGRVLDRPDAVLRQWDAITARRRVVALAGTDAHARLGASEDGPARSVYVPLPGYESMFRTFSITAAGVRFTGDAKTDSAALLEAIRRGRVYSAIDAVAGPAVVSFGAVRGDATFEPGDFVPPGAEIEIQVRTNAPQGSRIVLLNGGETEVVEESQSLRRIVPGTRAVYRVEIQVPGSPGEPPVPWVVTNPIYVRTEDERIESRRDPSETTMLYRDGDAAAWRVEASARSKGAIDVVRAVEGTELLLRWAIGGTAGEGPYAAFAMPAGAAFAAHDRLRFTARADRPTRLSVQFRTANGDRWRRSIYVDHEPREIVVFFDDVRPAGVTSVQRLPMTEVRDLLFVVDTVNASPGTSGQLWIGDVAYAR